MAKIKLLENSNLEKLPDFDSTNIPVNGGTTKKTTITTGVVNGTVTRDYNHNGTLYGPLGKPMRLSDIAASLLYWGAGGASGV